MHPVGYSLSYTHHIMNNLQNKHLQLLEHWSALRAGGVWTPLSQFFWNKTVLNPVLALCTTEKQNNLKACSILLPTPFPSSRSHWPTAIFYKTNLVFTNEWEPVILAFLVLTWWLPASHMFLQMQDFIFPEWQSTENRESSLSLFIYPLMDILLSLYLGYAIQISYTFEIYLKLQGFTQILIRTMANISPGLIGFTTH